MEVQVRINVAKDIQREVTLTVPEHTTVGSLIRRVCKEYDFPMKSNYVLTIGDTADHLRWSSKLKNCNIQTRTLVVLSENEDGKTLWLYDMI
jgi:folate-dependent tRNA-U54 methylase TrmFO/GidA